MTEIDNIKRRNERHKKLQGSGSSSDSKQFLADVYELKDVTRNVTADIDSLITTIESQKKLLSEIHPHLGQGEKVIVELQNQIKSQKEEIENLQKDNKFLTIVNDRYTKSAMAKCAPYYNNEGVYCHGDGEPIKGYTDYKAITELKNEEIADLKAEMVSIGKVAAIGLKKNDPYDMKLSLQAIEMAVDHAQT